MNYSSDEYANNAAAIIMAHFKVELQKLVGEFMEKYPPLEGITIPQFFVLIKKVNN